MRTCEERIKDCDDCKIYNEMINNHDDRKCKKCRWNRMWEDNFIPKNR